MYLSWNMKIEYLELLVQTFTPLPTKLRLLVGYLGRVLSSSMEVWWRLRLPEE